jgi:predicted transcriptional regulator
MQTTVYQPIPPELREQEQWVCWQYEKRAGKWTKVPYDPHTGKQASTTNPETWAGFEEAVTACERGGYSGIGYVFAEDDPFAGVDLDDCVCPETGAIEVWAWELVDDFNTYAEISPSGGGLHLIMRGKAPDRKNQRAGVEAYSTARFFTITGDAVTGGGLGTIPDRQGALDRLCAQFFPPDRPDPTDPTPPPSAAEPVGLDDRALLDKARGARNGAGDRFTALYDRGEFLDHPSHSEARHELLRHLAFWSAWDPERMSRLYEGSALHNMPGYARKWARLGDRECKNAIAATPRAYGQHARAGKEDGGELAHVIAALKAQAAGMPWEGRGGPTDRAVYDALLEIAATYGTIATKGVIISADMRSLALKAGTSATTARKALQRLREDRNLLRLSKKSTGTRAAVYLLHYPPAPQGLHTIQCVDYVQPLRELRNRGPSSAKEFDKNGRRISRGAQHLLERLGKLVALVVGRVAAAGGDGITPAELAAALDRRPDNVRRTVKKAADAGLVLEDEDGRLTVPDNLEDLLRVELEQSGCDDAKQRDAERYARNRESFRRRRERKADPGPTEEDMDRERLQRKQDALEALQTPGIGPALILQSYLKGETGCFEYVVNAVARHYGCAAGEMWKEPVEEAVAMIEELRAEPRVKAGA